MHKIRSVAGPIMAVAGFLMIVCGNDWGIVLLLIGVVTSK